MLKLDLNRDGCCCFCNNGFADKIEDHQRICLAGVNTESFYAKEKEILMARCFRLTDLKRTILENLINNVAIAVKNELSPDFCIKCTSAEQHARQSCLMMTRVQALDALIPNYEYEVVKNHSDVLNANYHAEIAKVSEKSQQTKEEYGKKYDIIIEKFRILKASPRKLRLVRRNQRRLIKEIEEQMADAKDRITKGCAELCSFGHEIREEVRTYYYEMRRRLMLEEAANPSGSMMRFVSTYNPQDARDTSIKLLQLKRP